MTEEEKKEDENEIVMGDEHVKGSTREYQSLTLTGVVKGQTSVGDDTFWMEFKTPSGDVIRGSYPIGRGSQGKLAQFLKAARAVLSLEPGADVEMTQLIDEQRCYKRVSRRWENADGEEVSYFFFVPADEDSLDAEEKEEVEQYAELIEKMQSGMTREDIYDVATAMGLEKNDVDIFMMRANKDGKLEKKGDTYTWTGE